MTDPKSKYKEILLNYLPEPAVDTMADWILHFNFNLKITENRASKLGDYRPPINNSRHSITINHNLNKYAFLITLVHEIAHLTTFEKYQRSLHKRVLPHGEEWKQEYKNLMRYYLNEQIFPEDVMKALIQYMHNPAASSCADENLLRVLRRHDIRRKSWVHIEELAIGTTFRYGKNRFFVKGERGRKRFKCVELGSKRVYLFSPLAEVVPVNQTSPVNTEKK
ncbi:MAG: SprT-like domain-containing protein [Bacteroidetes bacterium]|nr:SprT-like domain-containing protein [Bacteroidota bacterium]MBK9672977.1 SprT-like domain-containing protein [Bacteroidota bacterium]MBK9799171.1 SprT-like domain-containing protein [Bacteroidota bacterium]MBP6412272.1 SprT-like domain-containing protein [Bacteroidia bacterium]